MTSITQNESQHEPVCIQIVVCYMNCFGTTPTTLVEWFLLDGVKLMFKNSSVPIYEENQLSDEQVNPYDMSTSTPGHPSPSLMWLLRHQGISWTPSCSFS